MKRLRYVCLAAAITLSACTKYSAGIQADKASGTSNGWRLAQKQSSVAQAVPQITIPATDQVVTLQLNSDSTYSSKLNDQVVAQGQYSISIDTAYFNTPVLQLNNFTTTGIFNMLPASQVDAGGQVISTYTGLFMSAGKDTLTLKTPYFPGGYIAYTFVKN